MPTVPVYIKQKTWTAILKECGHDTKKIPKIIRELCEAKYGT